MIKKTTEETIIFGCVVDALNQKYLDQVVRLVMSLRWYGGAVKDAPLIIGSVGDMPQEYRSLLRPFNVDIRCVEPFHALHPHSNKLRFLEFPDIMEFDSIVLLDCDILIVKDPSAHLFPNAFAAKPADMRTVTIAQFKRIFNHFNLTPPLLSMRTDVTARPMYPYYNAGVCIFAKTKAEAFSKSWMRWCKNIIEVADQLHFPRLFSDQIAITCALIETGISCTELPSEMNFPVHHHWWLYRKRFKIAHPICIHYHHLGIEKGGVNKTSLTTANQYIAEFNTKFNTMET